MERSSTSCDILAYLVLLGKLAFTLRSVRWPIHETKYFPAQTLCFFHVSEQASPLLSFFPELVKEHGYKPPFIESRWAWTNPTPLRTRPNSGEIPGLASLAFRIWSDLCHYSNSITGPWDLESEITIKSTQPLPSVQKLCTQTWIWDYFGLRTHNSCGACFDL